VTTKVRPLRIPAAGDYFDANITAVDQARGVVLFGHGGESSRCGRDTRIVTDLLHRRGHCTVSVDLLTREEQYLDSAAARLRGELGPLAGRLVAVLDWLAREEPLAGLPIGLFGSGIGAAAALYAAAARPKTVRALVSRGGRPDLAEPFLAQVRAPTLLLVGDRDRLVIRLNEQAALAMKEIRRVILIRNAGLSFDGPGASESVARLTAAWFDRHLAGTDVS
jgi:putative phosphoribosyl transferase